MVNHRGHTLPWSRENPAIDIVGFDGVSDSGQEIYNFCKQEGIDKIVLIEVVARYLHFESRVRGAADDPARLRGRAGPGTLPNAVYDTTYPAVLYITHAAPSW